MNVYDFELETMDGNKVSLTDYKGKVLLIVNTATGCGFTPQYTDLQAIYDECHEQGLEIIDVPCNQFKEEAPGSNEEIHTFCTGRFGITFPQFAKAEVIGPNAIELFKWLAANTKFEGFEGPMGIILKGAAKSVDKDYRNNSNVKWNFTKFLIDKEGNIVKRFEPTAPMSRVSEAVKELL